MLQHVAYRWRWIASAIAVALSIFGYIFVERTIVYAETTQTLSGYLEFQGSPAPTGFSVFAYSPRSGKTVTAYIGANGTYKFDLPADTYTIYPVRLCPSNAPLTITVPDPDGLIENIIFQCPISRSAIQGFVLVDGEYAWDGFAVKAVHNVTGQSTTATTTNGWYRFDESLAPGTYNLSHYYECATGFNQAQQPPTSDTYPLIIKCPEHILKGYVTVNGKPLTSHWVSARDSKGNVSGAVIDKNGMYKFIGLPADTYIVSHNYPCPSIEPNPATQIVPSSQNNWGPNFTLVCDATTPTPVVPPTPIPPTATPVQPTPVPPTATPVRPTPVPPTPIPGVTTTPVAPGSQGTILIVHGFQGIGSDQYTCTNGLTESFDNNPVKNWDLAKWLIRDGYRVMAATWETGKYSTLSIAENVENTGCLAEQIAQAKQLLKQGQNLKVICHSMGCNLMRYYLESGKIKNAVDRIDTVIFMGGPHDGIPSFAASVCSRTIGLLSSVTGAKSCDLRAQEGFQDVLGISWQTFMKLSGKPSGVKYFAISGDAQSPIADVMRFMHVGFDKRLQYHTDFLVDTQSGLRIPSVDGQYVTNENHSSFDLFGVTFLDSYYKTPTLDLGTSDSYKIISKLLKGQLQHPILDPYSKKAQEILKQPNPSGDPAEELYLPISIKPNNTWSKKIHLTTGNALILINRDNEQRLIMLTSPDGKVWTTGSTPPNVTVTDRVGITSYVFNSAQPGHWLISIYNWTSQTQDMVFGVWYESSQKTNIAMSQPSSNKEPYVIAASIVDESTDVERIQQEPLDTATFVITQPDGSVLTSNSNPTVFTPGFSGYYSVDVLVEKVLTDGETTARTKYLTLYVPPTYFLPERLYLPLVSNN